MAAGSDEVLLDYDGAVAVVTLNAPDRRNALTPGMAAEFMAALDEVDGRSEVGALVVRGVGRSFCAGGDIATLTKAGEDPALADNYEGMSAIYDSLYHLGQMRVPTVAAVRGSAVGAGINMFLATDLRIAARDARLICGFLKRGLHPGGGRFVILSRLIGREAAAAMALFGEEINGDRPASSVWPGSRWTTPRLRTVRSSWRGGLLRIPSWHARRWATSATRSSTPRLPGRWQFGSSGQHRCGTPIGGLRSGRS